MAIWLASDVLDFRGEPAISGAWLERAHRLLDGRELTAEHGWLDLHEGTIALDLEVDSVTARRLGDRCAEAGRTLGLIDLEMLGMALAGQSAVHEGDVREGMRLLDQAALAATTGELDELVAVGWSCCSLIKACEEIRDHERAAQWSQQTLAFAQRVRFDPWFGCECDRAALLRPSSSSRRWARTREHRSAKRRSHSCEAIRRLRRDWVNAPFATCG